MNTFLIPVLEYIANKWPFSFFHTWLDGSRHKAWENQGSWKNVVQNVVQKVVVQTML